MLGEPAGEKVLGGQLLQESPLTFRYVLMGHSLQALLTVEPAGEVAPEGQAMHELPFRYVLKGHLSLQAALSVDPAGELVPDGHGIIEGAFP